MEESFDPKSLAKELLDLYKKEIISEKSFKILLEILITLYLENRFFEKYLPKFDNLDNKLNDSIKKVGERYVREGKF